MATKSRIKKNQFAKELYSKKYKIRIVRPKKGKGSFSRKNIKV
ncbi:MAG: alternative ribosome rescue factor ArfA [Pseudomonadota bacterium]|nr:alternative ribosome rescue factor ArfA [Pseudomonadota bacterium]